MTRFHSRLKRRSGPGVKGPTRVEGVPWEDAFLETGRRRARKIAEFQDVPEALRRIGGHVSHRLQLFDSDVAGNPISWGFLFGYSR